jgi:spore germination protein GerM
MEKSLIYKIVLGVLALVIIAGAVWFYQQNKSVTVKLYFLNPGAKPMNSCTEVMAVTRKIKADDITVETLKQLLKGPTNEEIANGFRTAIPEESRLNYVDINANGETRVDFNKETQSGGGSCGMLARLTQIKETLRQFPNVKNIVPSIDGQTEGIFQP